MVSLVNPSAMTKHCRLLWLVKSNWMSMADGRLCRLQTHMRFRVVHVWASSLFLSRRRRYPPLEGRHLISTRVKASPKVFYGSSPCHALLLLVGIPPPPPFAWPSWRFPVALHHSQVAEEKTGDKTQYHNGQGHLLRYQGDIIPTSPLYPSQIRTDLLKSSSSANDISSIVVMEPCPGTTPE
jgi:hypothetical protein